MEPIGFCGGVKAALAKAKEWAFSGRKCYMLFPPVHNELVAKSLEESGLILLDGDDVEALIAKAKDGLLLFGAHGHPDEYEEIAKRLGVDYVDLTCPYVKHYLEALKEETKDHDVVFLGEKGHQECIAALSISPRIFLFEEGNTKEIPVKDQTPIFRCQTTVSLDELNKARAEVAEAFPCFIDRATPCSATMARQSLAWRLPSDTKSAVVLGSSTSRNTISLYEAIKRKHPEMLVLRVLNAYELAKYGDELKEKGPVALLSGTSSDDIAIEGAKAYLESL